MHNTSCQFPILPLDRTPLGECEERSSTHLFTFLPLDGTSLGEFEERALSFTTAFAFDFNFSPKLMPSIFAGLAHKGLAVAEAIF